MTNSDFYNKTVTHVQLNVAIIGDTPEPDPQQVDLVKSQGYMLRYDDPQARAAGQHALGFAKTMVETVVKSDDGKVIIKTLDAYDPQNPDHVQCGRKLVLASEYDKREAYNNHVT